MVNLSILAGIGAGLLASGLSFIVVGSGGGIWFERIRLNGSSSIISKYKQLPCSGNLFESITWVAHAKNEETRKKIETNKSIVLKNDQLSGCVSIWWKKEIYANENWKGVGNLVWAMKDDSYGTILVSTATANNGKIEIDGAFYVLQKTTNDSWTTIGSWIRNKKKIENNVAGEMIQAGASLSGYRKAWDFLKEEEFNSTSQKVCSSNRPCRGSPSKSSIHKNWKYTTEITEDTHERYKNHKADAWGENINSTWINGMTIFNIDATHIYSQTMGYYKLENE